MKLDPWKHKEKYLKWKNGIEGVGYIKGISKANSDLVLRYIFDMEVGINVSAKSVKGARSYIRLNNLKQRMIFLSKFCILPFLILGFFSHFFFYILFGVLGYISHLIADSTIPIGLPN